MPSSERATAELTDLPDSERPADESETSASPARTPSTPRSGDAPTVTVAPETATATATAPPAASGSAERDREALVALYNAAAGPNWKSNNNWLTDVPIGEWSGVTTDDNGHVTELELVSNQLSGEIPLELGSLASLTDLLLFGNQLSGEIPSELGNVASLRWMNLGGNQLSGEIPPEAGKLANLEWVGLAENRLSGEIPPELGKLADLTDLILDGNLLSGCVPSSLFYRLNLDYSNLGDLRFCP